MNYIKPEIEEIKIQDGFVFLDASEEVVIGEEYFDDPSYQIPSNSPW